MIGKKEIRIDVVKLALSTQLAVLGLVELEKIGMDIPIVRESIAFLYLAFLPGVLLLRVLDIKLSLVRFIVLSLGTSLSLVTFFIAMANVLLYSLGVKRPLSEIYLIISLTVLIITLLLTTILLKKKIFFATNSLDLRKKINILDSFLLLLPLLGALGNFRLWYAQDNFLVIVILIILSVIPLFVVLDKIPPKKYPWLILSASTSISLANLPHVKSLGETAISGVVKTARVWDPSFPSQHNSLLTQAILHPVFSIMLHIDIWEELYIINALIFSFIPLVLYEIYIDYFDRKIAFLSSYVFIASPILYAGGIVTSTRTGFGILFVALLLLSMLAKVDVSKKLFPLSILFAFSCIISHYGVSYLLMISLTLSCLIYFRLRCKEKDSFNLYNFATLYICFTLAWYIYTSHASNLNLLVGFAKRILLSLSEPSSSEAFGGITAKTPSMSLTFTKLFISLIIFLILIGASNSFINVVRNKTGSGKYEIFAIPFALQLLIMLLPGSFGGLRIFAMSLVLAAPYSVIGFITFLKSLGLKDLKCVAIFSIFLLISLQFNTGVISNIANNIYGKTVDYSHNSPIDREKILKGDNFQAKRKLYEFYPPDSSITGAEWLLTHIISGDTIYADSLLLRPFYFIPAGGETSFVFLSAKYGGSLVYENMKPPKLAPITTLLIEKRMQKGYLFLTYHNVVDNLIVIEDEHEEYEFYQTSDYISFFEKYNKVYSNGGSVVYYAK